MPSRWLEQSKCNQKGIVEIKIFSSADEVAQLSARYIEELIQETLSKKDFFTMALSGGRTPWEMLKYLAKADLPWHHIHLFQVDERMAPDGHADRNLTQLFKAIEGSPLVTQLHIYPMPVTREDEQHAAKEYATTLQEITGNGMLDLVHLGLGNDGHTASLVPGDSICLERNKDIAWTQAPYQGRFRMSMTYPLLNRSKKILWVVTGLEKSSMVQKLLSQDPSIPAGSIAQESALLIADQEAASLISRT